MGSFGHREITITATSGIIDPKDFESNLHDARTGRTTHHWNCGPMRHVVEALAGTPVVIVVDRMTGFTLVGAVLVDVRGRYYSNGMGVAISTECGKTAQNPQGITVYDLRSIGAIIPLQDSTHGLRTAAMQSERRELDLAREIYTASLPDDRPAGHVKVSSFNHEVHASYRTQSLRERGPSWARISRDKIKAASLCDTCLKSRETESHEYHCPTFTIELEARMVAQRT